MRFAVLIPFLCLASSTNAQTPQIFAKTIKQLRSFAQKDSLRVQSAVNKWWEERKKLGQVPLTSSDSSIFLYRGTATSVLWAGDFNGWGSKPAPTQGKRIRNTDIWIAPCTFPSKARLDYKIILNGKDWILDPVNPNQQYSGVGGGSPNSEIRMPAWKRSPDQIPGEKTPRGLVSQHTIWSQKLGYEVDYQVYLPAGHIAVAALPVLYVFDGNEYNDPRLGNMATSLDNLIASGSIVPMAIVFIDAREHANKSNNRRTTELSLNEDFLAFVTDELIPAVGDKNAEARGILGTSLGGLSAAFFALSKPAVFPRVACQSPAYWYKPEIFGYVEKEIRPPLRAYISAGTFFDGAPEAKRMVEQLQKHGHSVKFTEVPEGHSWGNWRNLLSELLIELYGKR